MEEITEVEEHPMTVYQIFDMAWLKCRRWVDDNALAFVGEEKALLLSRAMNRQIELVIIVLSDKLVARAPEEAGFKEVEERRTAITNRDHAYAQAIARKLLEQPDLTLPPEIINKGYDFASVFLALVDQINSK